MIWNKSKMASLYYSKDEADTNWICVVKFTDVEIMIEYDDDGLVRYSGKNDGSGHFDLHAPERGGRATLHQFPDSQVLEGSWIEHGERGMWRIELAD